MKVTHYKYNTPLKIVLLSDLHNNPYEKIIKKVSIVKPDIITIPGDLVKGYVPNGEISILEEQKNVIPFLKGCSEIAPTFMSIGNHDWMIKEREKEIIKSCGVTLLDNEYVIFRNVAIGGLTFAFKLFFDETDTISANMGAELSKKVPELNWLDEFEKRSEYKLLLCHHPEYYFRHLKNKNIDLVVAGHCHGGQIRLFGHGLYAPGQGILPKYTKGIYEKLIISTGLAGTIKFVPRLFNPREVVVIEPDCN